MQDKIEGTSLELMDEEAWEEEEIEEQALAVNPEDVKGRYLTFWLADQLYGMTIAYTEQIIGMQTLTAVPGYPFYAKGVINLRGYNIPVVDMRLRFGKPEAEYGERTCVIINKFENGSVGFIVDAVNEVANIEPEQILPPPVQGSESFLLGIGRFGNEIVMLIEPTRLFGEADVRVYGHMGG